MPGALCLLVLGLFVSNVARKPSVDTLALGLVPSPIDRRFLIAILVFTLGSSSDAFLLWRAREAGIAVALAPILVDGTAHRPGELILRGSLERLGGPARRDSVWMGL